MAADLILPAAMWVEKEGAYGNAERRTHVWRQLVKAPGEAAPTCGSSWSSPSASPPTRCGRRRSWTPIPTIAARRCSTCCSATARSTSSPLSRCPADYENREAKAFGFYVQKGLFEEYAAFGRGHGHDLAPFDTYHEVRGLRWPVVDGKETKWRYREGLDPYVKAGQGRGVLRQPGRQGADHRGALRAAGGIPRQGLRPLAGHRPRARALALRLHDHARAGTLQGDSRRLVFMHADDARAGHQ